MTGRPVTGFRGAGGDLTWHIERDGPVTTVVLQGRLGYASAPGLRTGLLKCLAECPVAVILDLTSARVEEDLALLVIPSITREGSEWPPVPLLLCGADDDLRGRLARLRITRHARYYPTRALARAAAMTPAALADWLAVSLPAQRSAPAQARELVEHACVAWQLPDLVAAAHLVVSELCANAVNHGLPPLRLILTHTGPRLHLVVRDGSRQLPRIRQRPADGRPMEGGNGMHLVAAFASAWGALPTVDGKAVWAAIR